MCLDLLSCRVSHPSSDKSFWILHNFVPPVIILAASWWMRSSYFYFFFDSVEQLSQTASLYSIKGRMNDIYIRSRACLRSLNFKALSRLSLGHAFSTMFFTWSDQVQELLKVIPRCLCVFFRDVCVVHFESRVRFRYSFPRYQKRGSFSRIKVYLPIVNPVVYCP